ncbi:MAG: hypothetical protein A3H72_00530 [Candidatus Doudnabacteria bacterium RIFCSPLOWO2_02_FULL_48_8]|uniref:Aminoglycoside phosphotransferase domain-containing protein n=1 Tax=Candidatus Doudnabacteria bacterium RIFCSPHIGHO2_01_FULL_46_24 TaxID=1817825 RepID=A0A1F5NUJ0_9BACT|nr:MAG: hypothetical protein A2720_01485 [Candidatus Doudnabacteria bacterium RIFCSPHIGHO2_01_FULL_46_24]OGE95577.1 MAG: hypothetical protein A3H72_00530 [Candidatus Doudnabacteria bacterium RIFCSPLOWO2_02_FULL_48_8]OGE95798.1 MAG: hypothetical protein A3E98_02220 [Candidatus Doudnabacteria bacterium RIFCSPHIGHO2_12_FULL_48_11]
MLTGIEEYKKVIEENFSGLKVKSIEKIGEGWDNFAFLANGGLEFRFPQDGRDYLIKQIQAEICLMPKLQDFFNLAIPNFQYVGKHKDLPFVGYSQIVGVPLKPDLFGTLSASAKTRAAKDLADFVSKLHSFPLDVARQCVAWEETSKEIYTKKHQRLPELQGRIPQRLIGYLESQFRFYFQELAEFESPAVLVHQDLSPDHIIYNWDNQKIEGIIDFGDIAISDPDLDLRWMVDPDDFTPDFLDEFLQYYQHPNPGMLKKKLMFFWNVSALVDLFHGIDNQDEKKFATGIKYLERNAKS